MTTWRAGATPGPFDDPLSYPGPIPHGSYLLAGGGVHESSALDLDGRVPVLATGSNASPPQLWRKLGDDAEVAVCRAHARGLDVRYSAHITRYGAMPATAWPAPGADCALHVLFLTPEQLATLDRSEPTYVRVSLSELGASTRITSGGHLDPAVAAAYVSKRGWYRLDRAPVLLPGHGSAPVLDQAEVLDTVLDLIRRTRPAEAPEDAATLAAGARSGRPPFTPAGLTALIAGAHRAGGAGPDLG